MSATGKSESREDAIAKRVLRSLRSTPILGKLSPEELSRGFYSSNLILEDELQQIESQKSDFKKVEKILSCVQRAGEAKALNELIRILEQERDRNEEILRHIHTKLENEHAYEKTSSPTISGREVSDYHSTSKNQVCDLRNKIIAILVGIIVVLAIFCMILYAATVFGILHLYQKNEYKDPNPSNVSVDVGNLPREIGDRFHTSHIGKVKLYMPDNSTKITSYFGKCSEVGEKTTRLPPVTINRTNITANSTIPVNYDDSHQFPIYALNNSNITYSAMVSFVSTDISKNSTKKNGCAFIYLFNTSESYHMFLDNEIKTEPPYFNKSECIILKQPAAETQLLPINHTIVIKNETFIFGAVFANVSYNAVITISGFRREHDVSRLTKSSTTINLCTKDKCNYFGMDDEDYCIFVNSTTYTRINYTEDSVPFPIYKRIVLEYVILVGVAGLFALLLTLGIALTCCACCLYCKSAKRNNSGRTPSAGKNLIAKANSRSSEPKNVSGHDAGASVGLLSKDALLDDGDETQ